MTTTTEQLPLLSRRDRITIIISALGSPTPAVRSSRHDRPAGVRRLHFDGCPVRLPDLEVDPHGPRFSSLKEINRAEGKKRPCERDWSYGWSMIRIGALLRRKSMADLDAWHERSGWALHMEGLNPRYLQARDRGSTNRVEVVQCPDPDPDPDADADADVDTGAAVGGQGR